ncbi:aromatic ring-hydroxylating dioxygenase subunit alpha [Variovorax sp.]|jgi:benzoate/toluate 1,2-dioxygenase subunit alpha|uniref:aromatic ring-hydroxylating dioxygenase subunit alpha n=1 Tax=Variovorax sp. TaxID=1871043 RepID=UPI0012100731|nr:aromatic ring-hydroxylating dioxygenase subunit alpha [Variovorax sp.]TAJ62381.1 MAG: oxidoreductase [Variovorax sp.]
MTSYRGNPDAVRALVRPDRVHRDLYISEEIFALEQEHFFANTWNYVGHESQLPKPGDYITNEIAGRPLIVVRHADGSVRVLMNRCAHKGSRLVSAPCGNTGKFFRCPYHAWTFKTDGSLLSIPLKNGYEGTQLHDCEASKGLVPVAGVRSYRGFVFVKINDVGPSFEEYFGDSLSSIDNMADRSPEGELEIAGGCLRFTHQCNWKMFVENLNDTMHPMVAHESSAGTAKTMWAGKPADEPKPMAIEQFVPFMSDYKFFEDMGVRTYDNGHSFTGVNFSIHSKYKAIPAYDDAMKARYGEERTAQILGMARHNTVYYPNLTIKGAIQAIRVVKPVSAGMSIVESWTFRLKGAPPELLQRTTMYSRLINSPFSVVGHDDLQAYRGMQAGLHASGNEWVSLHRNFEDGEEGRSGEATTVGTSELPMRNQYRSWARYMTETM